MKIDKELKPGHWIVLPANPESRAAGRRRRSEYIAQYGPLEQGERVKRSCDEPDCVRPEHARVASADRTRESILTAWHGGANVGNIADDLHLSRKRVKDFLFEAGELQPGARSPKMSDAARERVDLLIREGLPDRWVAEDVGVSTDMVRGRREALGVRNTEWIRVQLACRKLKALAPLHELFNPSVSTAP